MLAALRPQLEGHTFSLIWESVAVDVLGEVALLFARGSATLTTSSRHDTFGYRLTGVLVRDNGRWLWRVHHGSEPGAW
jgi:hypothetical protein